MTRHLARGSHIPQSSENLATACPSAIALPRSDTLATRPDVSSRAAPLGTHLVEALQPLLHTSGNLSRGHAGKDGERFVYRVDRPDMKPALADDRLGYFIAQHEVARVDGGD